MLIGLWVVIVDFIDLDGSVNTKDGKHTAHVPKVGARWIYINPPWEGG